MNFKVLGDSFRIDELILFVFLFLVFNPISYTRIHPIVFLIAFLAWMISAYFTASNNLLACLRNPMFIVASIYPLILLACSLRDDVVFEKRSINDCLVILIMLFYFKYNGGETVKKAYNFIVFYLVAISLYSIGALIEDSEISRNMAGSAKEIGNFLTGGYFTVYGEIFLAIAILGVAVDRKRKISDWILFLLFSTFIVMSNYATAFVFLAVGIIFVALGRNKYFKKVLLLCVGIFVLVTAFYPQGLVDFIFFIAELCPEGSFQAHRVRQVGEVLSNFITYGVIDSATTSSWDGYAALDRVDLYKQAFNTIRSNPVLGVGNVSKGLVGGHATFLDVMGEYGLIVGSIFVFTKIFVLARALKMIPGRFKFCYCVVGAMYIALGFFNNIKDIMLSGFVFLVIPYLFVSVGGRDGRGTVEIAEKGYF